MLDTNRQLVAQQDTYAQARGNIATNLIALYKALGGGWETRQGGDFVPEATRQKMGERTDWGDLLEVPKDQLPSRKPGADPWRSPDW